MKNRIKYLGGHTMGTILGMGFAQAQVRTVHSTSASHNNNNNNFPQSGPALQGCTVNVPVPKAVSS